MYKVIHGGLNRQAKALGLLFELLNEEFSLLMERKTEEIMTLEFSIHTLLRQLATEKINIQKLLNGGKFLDYTELLPEIECREALQDLWQNIDDLEQSCARQASLNTELSLALLDQSKTLLTYLHQKIQPKTPPISTYGRSGTYTNPVKSEASIITGRL